MPSKRDYRIFFFQQFWFAACMTFLPAWILCDVFLHINIFSTGLLVWLGIAVLMFLFGLGRAAGPKEADEQPTAQLTARAELTSVADPPLQVASVASVLPADECQALTTHAIALAERWMGSGQLLKARCDHCGHSEDVGIDWLSQYLSKHVSGGCRDCLQPMRLHFEEPHPEWDSQCMDDCQSLERAAPVPRLPE